MPKPDILAAGAGTTYDWSKDRLCVKTPHALTGGRATVAEDTLKPGFLLPRHHHRSMTEIFYILDGQVEFRFDAETVQAGPGMTLNIPPLTWHAVSCAGGGRLITIFSPGGFEDHLAELAGLTPEQFADEARLTALAEKYDSWTR